MSDDELDRDWKPSNRPQSTMARSFSLALNDLFKIDNSLADLDAAVSEKKLKVSSQTSELEALEARLKATEERLKAAASRSPPNARSGRSSPRPRAPIGDIFSPTTTGEHTTSPLATEVPRPGSGRSATGTGKSAEGRPTTGSDRQAAWRQGSMGGNPAALIPVATPPTPGTSEDGTEYIEERSPPSPPPKDST